MSNTKKTPGALCAGAALAAASIFMLSAPAHAFSLKPNAQGKTEFQCLVEAIYFEARSEPVSGQVAVGQVVLNRVESPLYPDTICDVVYQNEHLRNRCQFSFACDGKPEKMDESEAYADAVVVAKKVMACDDGCREKKGGVASSTFYHADYVDPSWASSFRKTGTIGRHIFYFSETL